MKKFNAKKEVDKIVSFIQNYYQENHLGGVVIGISGGKDSAVVAGLFTKALGKEHVIGVTLPCHSLEEDRSDAKKISDFYGFELINFDLTKTFDTWKDEVGKLGSYTEEQVKNSDINVKPKFRTAALYYLAALYSALKGETYLVAGTSNKCELYVGYFTKGGDSVSDILTLADLTVEQVIQIGEVLEVPKDVLYKTPSDGLSGQSDEEKLQVKYSEIASYMEDPTSVEKEVALKIEKLHKQSRHKFVTPTYHR